MGKKATLAFSKYLVIIVRHLLVWVVERSVFLQVLIPVQVYLLVGCEAKVDSLQQHDLHFK